MIVVDASVASSYLMSDEDATTVDWILRQPELIAPSLLDVEVLSAALNGIRRGRLSLEQAAAVRADLARLPILRIADSPSSLSQLYEICLTHNLSVYDGLYLDLAVRRNASLSTFDRRLMAAATAEGVALLPNRLSTGGPAA